MLPILVRARALCYKAGSETQLGSSWAHGGKLGRWSSPLCVVMSSWPLLPLQGFVKVYCKFLRPLFHQYRGHVDPFLQAASRHVVSVLPGPLRCGPCQGLAILRRAGHPRL